MKKIGMIIMVCLCCGGHIFGQGIQFVETTLEEALALAKKENKLVFIDFYADWCGPCKQMAADVFTREEVGGIITKSL